MSKISKKILDDLEFPVVIDYLKNHCVSSEGKSAISKLKPFVNKLKAIDELEKVNEVLFSFTTENHLPSLHFDSITKDLDLIQVSDSFSTIEAYNRVRLLSENCHEVLVFLGKFEEQFPKLSHQSSKLEINDQVHVLISKVINGYGEVDDKASKTLRTIRRHMSHVRGQIGDSFNKALAKYSSHGVLDDIRESVMENRRVLAVQAMYRKKVKGSVIGSSKTGSIVFISPESTLKLEHELQDLIFSEKQEIIKILKELNDQLRPYVPLLRSYQLFLTYLDTLRSRAKYAKEINACLPEFSKDKTIQYIEAYHPLLFSKNRKDNIETIPQNVILNPEQQIIVISGPNAGGKSITLKTIGLLQVMLQSGVLIPVKEGSKTHFFDTILTDIGDNQSIENQLSTYSYRLKNMRNFLQKCNDNTLFLIDEFGTGSDPELGGALAEIFLEEFYQKGAYGVITTHYSNLKVLADELDHVQNACMLFDRKSLKPLFKLEIGQAGSSFTFEVAQKNGIPYSLINRAKKRVETEKVRLDKTISKLQDQRRKLQNESQKLANQASITQSTNESLSDKEQKLQDKLERFQALYDENQKMLSIGRKTNELLNKYFQTNNKKELITEFNKWVAQEKTKYTKKNPPKINQNKAAKRKEKEQSKQQEKAKKVVLAQVEKEVLQKVVKVRKEKSQEAAKIEKQKANYNFKLGDRVRLIDSKSVGSIDKIEKDQITINYGLFTTKARKKQIELVEAKKG